MKTPLVTGGDGFIGVNFVLTVLIRRYAHLSGDHLRQAARALESGRIDHKLSRNRSQVDFIGSRDEIISS
jgi:nucleoside-diphosphate-sugar epimerase